MSFRTGSLFLLLLAACGGESGPSRSDLQTLVRNKDYALWSAEPAIHGPTLNSPHGRVRIYFNDAYLAARRTSTFPMPVDAMSVKELYSSSDELAGYTVSVKVAEGSGADTWLWWEAALPDLEGGWYGIAEPVCERCHSAAAARDRSLIETVP